MPMHAHAGEANDAPALASEANDALACASEANIPLLARLTCMGMPTLARLTLPMPKQLRLRMSMLALARLIFPC